MILKSQQGFSLIELIVVMIMIAGLVSIVAPNTMKSLKSSQRFIEEKKLNSLIKQVSKLAFYSSSPAKVEFDNGLVNIKLNNELYKSESFSALIFEKSELYFSATGFLNANSIAYKIKDSDKSGQLLIDCEASFVICKS